MSETNDYLEQLADRHPDATPEELKRIMKEDEARAKAAYESEKENEVW